MSAFAWTCFSFGGISSALAAAFLTQNYEPRYCFLLSSVFGLLVALIATRLNVNLEVDEEELAIRAGRDRGCWNDVKRNFYEIKEAFKIREYFSTVLYILLGGLLVPTFYTFGYYFYLNVVGLSKFMYAMLTVIAYICLLIGSRIY